MPHPKDNVFVRIYLNGSQHIFSKSEEELIVRKLRNRPKKRDCSSNSIKGTHLWKVYNNV